MDIQQLEPYIRSILTAPGTDLSTISAKRVRKQLVEQYPIIPEDYVRNNKPQIDLLIKTVFEAVNETAQSDQPLQPYTYGEPEESKQVKREDEDEYERDDEDEDNFEHAASSPKTKPLKHKTTKSGMTDEEYARQLSSELNGRAARGVTRSAKTNGKLKQSKSPRKARKSAPHVEDSDDESGGGFEGKKSKRKSKGGGGAKGGFGKEFILSAPLSALLEVDKLSRPQVVKRLWAHIKGNGLQNPVNKREILCDHSLRAIFNVDKIDMFRMNKVLGQHLHEQE